MHVTPSVTNKKPVEQPQVYEPSALVQVGVQPVLVAWVSQMQLSVPKVHSSTSETQRSLHAGYKLLLQVHCTLSGVDHNEVDRHVNEQLEPQL